MCLKEVRSTLHSRELWHSCSGTVSDSQTFIQVANNNQGYCKSEKNKFSHKPVSRGPKPINICNYCKEIGHWKHNCPKKRHMKQEKASCIVVVVEDGTHSKEDIVLVTDSHTYYIDVWVLDSRASYHICPMREWFSTYENLHGGNIAMSNSSVCKVVRMNTIKIRTHTGKLCTLNKVRHVPIPQ